MPETGSGMKEGNMKKRVKMGKKRSKKLFSRTAGRTHKKNVKRPIMRGGIRL